MSNDPSGELSFHSKVPSVVLSLRPIHVFSVNRFFRKLFSDLDSIVASDAPKATHLSDFVHFCEAVDIWKHFKPVWEKLSGHGIHLVVVVVVEVVVDEVLLLVEVVVLVVEVLVEVVVLVVEVVVVLVEVVVVVVEVVVVVLRVVVSIKRFIVYVIQNI